MKKYKHYEINAKTLSRMNHSDIILDNNGEPDSNSIALSQGFAQKLTGRELCGLIRICQFYKFNTGGKMEVKETFVYRGEILPMIIAVGQIENKNLQFGFMWSHNDVYLNWHDMKVMGGLLKASEELIPEELTYENMRHVKYGGATIIDSTGSPDTEYIAIYQGFVKYNRFTGGVDIEQIGKCPKSPEKISLSKRDIERIAEMVKRFEQEDTDEKNAE